MLINVQFLRFAAAMLVVVYHVSAHVRDAGIDPGPLFLLSEAVGFAGVDIFFVISGFIMAYTTHSAAGIVEAWAFARRRMARIYSGYWPFFLLALALFFWVNPDHIQSSDLVRSAILWPTNHLLIAVSWTLIFEMFFYLLFSVLIVFSLGRRELLLWLLLVLVIAWSVFSQFGRHAYDPGQLEYISLAEYYMLSPYLGEFLAGSILAGMLRTRPGNHSWIWLLAGISLFLLGGLLNNRLFEGSIEQGYYVFFRVLVFGVPSLMILMGMVRLEQEGIRAPLRFSIRAGGASYAIYLSHTLLLTASQHLGLNEFAGQLGVTTAQLLYISYALVILVYSVIHYHLLERPLHRGLKKLLLVDQAKIN